MFTLICRIELPETNPPNMYHKCTVAGNYFEWGQPGWKKMVWAKAAVCSEVMRAGYDVFWSDADAIWFQSPFFLLEQHPEVQIEVPT